MRLHTGGVYGLNFCSRTTRISYTIISLYDSSQLEYQKCIFSENAILTENWLEFREDLTNYECSMVSVFDNDTTEWNSDGKMLNEFFQIFCLHRIQNITMKIVQTFTYAIQLNDSWQVVMRCSKQENLQLVSNKY